MKKRSIQLVKYQFVKLSCEWIEGNKAQENQNLLTINYNVFRNDDDPELFRLDFYVRIKPEENNQGLSVDVKMNGFFHFPKGIEEDEMQNLIRINGCSILYSTLRGHISVISSNFPNGSHILPSIVMADVVESIEKARVHDNLKDTIVN